MTEADTAGTAAALRPRERQRAATLEDIKRVALAQMAQDGVASLSLAKVARAVGLSPQGLYRYVAGRDELMTDLIVDAYDDLADVLEAARDRARARQQHTIDHRDLWLAVTNAFRRWAIEAPTRFALIYGAPVPAYQAPSRTEAPALRSNFLLLGLIAQAHQDGALDPTRAALTTSRPLEEALAAYTARRNLPIPVEVLRLGLSAWTRLHGLLTLEAFGHLSAVLPDAQPLFDAEMHSLLDHLGYPPLSDQTSAAAGPRAGDDHV